MVLDWLVAMDQYFELEEIKDSERVRFTTTKLKKTKRQAYGGHMYDRRGTEEGQKEQKLRDSPAPAGTRSGLTPWLTYDPREAPPSKGAM